jgi:hypothetical protein
MASSRAEYQRHYYQQHKEDLNRRRAEAYRQKKWMSTVKTILPHLDEMLVGARDEMLEALNNPSRSPPDDLLARAHLLTVIKLWSIQVE